jgi:hypothetical protein
MKFVPLLASCAFGLALSGCGDDGASSYKGPPPETVKAPPATATTATATAGTETPAAGTEPPATPATPNTDSAALCGTVLANSWKALQPALAMVGADAAQSEEAYTTNKYFIKKCSGLTATQVDCLSKSENPLVGIDECKINEGAKGSDKLRLPTFRKSRSNPPDLPEEQQAKLLKSVVGTWVSEFKSYNQKTTWKISKTGDVKVTLERSGKKQEKDLKIQFDREKQVRVQTSPTSSQWYSYLPVNKRTMLLCNNLAYGAHPISDEKDFVLATTGEHIAFKGEVCKVLTDSGHFVDATCAWEQKSKKKKSFTVSYDVPDRKSSTELTYDLIAGHLVDRRQVDTSTFVKK